MADAEKKNISKLDFNINDAINSLETVNQKLQQISKSSESYAKTIGDNLSKSINSGMQFNVNNVQTQLSQVQKLNEKNTEKVLTTSLQAYTKAAARNTATVQKEQSDINVIRERGALKEQEYLLKSNLSAQQSSQKKEEMAYKSALKQEEYNNRVLKSSKNMYEKIMEYAKTYVIYQGFNELRHAITETIDEMVEIENQMVSIDRVMNESGFSIDNYRDKLINLAYEYGNAFDNVADITLRLAQAGFDSQEALKLTEKTLLALNTAELDATQATDDMVAIMAQWGLMTGDATEEAKAYGDIIDKINKVADNYPTTSADILDALKKTSSAFNLAGASIDETIATIAAAEIASQRGGKAIGTALSNITQQLKDAGRINIAESLGIDFYTDETKTEFKDIMDIFGELANKMQELKNAGKENSQEMQDLLSVFTVFRRNIGASLLGEMGGEDNNYFKILNDSLTATGYSLQENEKYMKTAKAAQAQFNATLLELKTKVWDAGLEDVFRSMLLLGQDIINVISGLVETFGSVPTAIGAATLAFTAFNKNIQTQIKYNTGEGFSFDNSFIQKIKNAQKEVSEFKNAMNKATSEGYKLSDSFKVYVENVGAANISTKGYISSLIEQRIATIAAEAATIALNAALSLGLSIGITAVISGINKLIHAEEEQQKKMQESIDAHKEKIDTYEQEKEEIDDLIKQYEELSNADANTPENLEKIQELKMQINNALAEEGVLVANINDSYDLQLNKLKEISKEKLKTLVDEQKKKVNKTLSKNKGTEYQSPTGVINLEPTKENIEMLEEQLALMTMAREEGTKAFGTIEEKLNTLEEQYNENNQAISDYINSLAELKKEEWFPEGTIENAEDLQEVVDKITEGNFNFSGSFESLMETLDLTDEQLEVFKQTLIDLVKNEYPNFTAEAELASGNLKNLDNVLSNHLETLQGYADKYATLRNAQDEYNKTGQLTISTLQGLIDNNLLQYLSLQNGQLLINAQSMLNLAEATKVKAIQELQDAAAMDLQKIATGDLQSISSIAKGAIAGVGNNSETAGQQMETAAGKAATLAVELQAVVDAASGNLGEGVDLETYKKQAQAIINTYSNMANQISKINIKTASYKPQKVSGSSSSSKSEAERAAKEAEEAAKKAAEEAAKAEEEAYKKRLEQFKDYIDEKEKLEERWVDKQDELGQLSNEDFLYITQQRIERYKKYLDEVKKATWMHEEDKLELTKEYSEKIEDLQVDYIGYLRDQLDEEIEALEEANDKKIELIEEEADKRIEALQKVEDENDRIRAKEEYEKKRQEHLDDISYWEQRTGREAQEALKEAKKNLEELDEEWQQQLEDWSIEDQIKAIEEERDAQIEAIQKTQEEQIAAWEAAYDAKVKLFAETGQIIYENTVIQSQALYNAYKQNFIDPISKELANLNKVSTPAPTPKPTQPTQQYETYTIKYGDTLSAIAKKFGTTVEKIMAANPYITNKNKIYAGKNLQIPKFHEGGIVGGNYEEGLALLKKGEVVLKPEWSASLDRMMHYFDNLSSNRQASITSGPIINVDGDLIKIEANVKNQSDIDRLERRLERMLKDKFNIKK